MTATVDIRSYYRDPANLPLNAVSIDLSSHWSDVQDINYATWNRFELSATVKTVWSEYVKKKQKIGKATYIDIPEPKLW